MNSFKDVYYAMTEQDMAKEAQAQVEEHFGVDMSGVDDDLIKQAQDYDYIGRVLAHQVMGDLIKEALDETMPGASEDEKKKQLAAAMAKARGEEGKKESEDEDEEEEEEEEEEAEKKAAVQIAILEKMASDPEYLSYLLSKHYPG